VEKPVSKFAFLKMQLALLRCGAQNPADGGVRSGAFAVDWKRGPVHRGAALVAHVADQRLREDAVGLYKLNPFVTHSLESTWFPSLEPVNQ
jgi:hypothetical protein